MKEHLFYALTGLRNFLIDSCGFYDSWIVDKIDDIRYKITPEDYE